MASRPHLPSQSRNVLVAAAILSVATLLAWSNSFGGPFVFDDLSSIETNASIRHLWPLHDALLPPAAETVGGRPLVNLSLALNFALGGLAVGGYHLFNLIIHLCAGLALFGVVRRTLVLAGQEPSRVALPAVIALLWLLHPLQTESVTYVVQRAEAMVGLSYLLTLYCAIRTIESPGQPRWRLLAILACAAGMLCKEVMVSAPFMVLLYDRIFASGSFRSAWRARRTLYLGLFGTLLLLAALVAMDGRGNTAGFDTPMSAWSYALTQAHAVTHYLRLVAWPHPLVFDYGTALDTLPQAAGHVALVLLLLAGTGYALWRRPAIGFVALAFFVVLAPSSSVVPIATQTMAEHRMYLALAGVLALAGLGLHALLGRPAIALCLAWAAALGTATWFRNRDYRSDAAIWQSTVDHLPGNARAQHNLGKALAMLGRHDEALAHYREAVRIDPAAAGVQDDLSRALQALNQLETPGGEEAYLAAIRQNPDSAELHVTLGRLLAFLKRPAEAIEHFEMALKIDPAQASVENELGKALGRAGHPDQAIEHFRKALRIDSTFAEAAGNIEIARRMLARPPR